MIKRILSAALVFSMFAMAGCSGANENGEEAAAESDQDLATVALGVDTNGSTLDIGHARANGVGFVARYVSFDGTHPALSASEVARFEASQMPLVAIWETGQKRTVETGSIKKAYAAGVADAKSADSVLRSVGATGRAVYFTVDFDVTPSFWAATMRDTVTQDKIQKGALIVAYFRGVKSVIGERRTGAYGTYTTLKNLFDEGLIHYGWQQTFASRGDKVDSRAQLRQYDIYPDQTGWGVAGAGALDLDRAVHADFGQW